MRLKITVVLLFTVLFAVVLVGCPAGNKTITEQMIDQQADPATISLAVYADALQIYVDAQELYLPYQEITRETDPEMDTRVLGEFRKARSVLDRWKLLGDVTSDDKMAFRNAIRAISLELAKEVNK